MAIERIGARVTIKRDTTANWNKHLDFIPMLGELIIYTDFTTDEEGKPVPNIKVGDGKAYLVDLPFLPSGGSMIVEHINNSDVHVNSQEREFWNNKLNCSINGENLILNRR